MWRVGQSLTRSAKPCVSICASVCCSIIRTLTTSSLFITHFEELHNLTPTSVLRLRALNASDCLLGLSCEIPAQPTAQPLKYVDVHQRAKYLLRCCKKAMRMKPNFQPFRISCLKLYCFSAMRCVWHSALCLSKLKTLNVLNSSSSIPFVNRRDKKREKDRFSSC